MVTTELAGFSRKQIRSIALANADASKQEINLWHGAIRSGKTVGSLVRFLIAIAQAPTTGEIVLIGRTRDTLYRNIISPMMNPSIYGEYVAHIEYNRGAPTATILGRTVHVIGASDARAENVIRGLTVCVAYVDEVSLVAEEFFNQLMGRCSVAGAWVGATTNPDSPQHWLKKKWIDKASWTRDDGTPGSHQIFHFSLRDNAKYLPDGTIEGYERQYTGLWRKRFIDGLWSIAEGSIYDMFDPAQHVVTGLPAMERVLSMGIDYGTTNPTAGLLVGLGVDRKLYVMAEWSPPKSTDSELSASLAAWLTSQPAPAWIFVDPAAASLKLQLHRDGTGRVADADNSVIDGIRTVAALLSSGHLFIHESCAHLIGELPGYVWDPKATKKGADAPVKLNDHFCDALRYGIASSRMLWQSWIPNLREAQRQPDRQLQEATA